MDGSNLGKLDAPTLTSKHVIRWLEVEPGWDATTKNNELTALQKGFDWAVKNPKSDDSNLLNCRAFSAGILDTTAKASGAEKAGAEG